VSKHLFFSNIVDLSQVTSVVIPRKRQCWKIKINSLILQTLRLIIKEHVFWMCLNFDFVTLASLSYNFLISALKISNHHSGVNFINLLWAHFSYKILVPKTLKLAFGFEILVPKILYEKCAWNVDEIDSWLPSLLKYSTDFVCNANILQHFSYLMTTMIKCSSTLIQIIVDVFDFLSTF